MTAHRLQMGRFAAADAVEALKLKALPGAIIAMGMTTEGEVYVARTVVVNAEGSPVDLGDVIVRWAQVYGALSQSITGWVVFRVAKDARITSPLPEDIRRARHALGSLGYDWTRAPFEQRERISAG